MTYRRGICRNIRYRLDEETLVYICDEKECGMFSSIEKELLAMHYYKIEKGVLVHLPLPAEKTK